MIIIIASVNRHTVNGHTYVVTNIYPDGITDEQISESISRKLSKIINRIENSDNPNEINPFKLNKSEDNNQ